MSTLLSSPKPISTNETGIVTLRFTAFFKKSLEKSATEPFVEQFFNSPKTSFQIGIAGGSMMGMPVEISASESEGSQAEVRLFANQVDFILHAKAQADTQDGRTQALVDGVSHFYAFNESSGTLARFIESSRQILTTLKSAELFRLALSVHYIWPKESDAEAFRCAAELCHVAGPASPTDFEFKINRRRRWGESQLPINRLATWSVIQHGLQIGDNKNAPVYAVSLITDINSGPEVDLTVAESPDYESLLGALAEYSQELALEGDVI